MNRTTTLALLGAAFLSGCATTPPAGKPVVVAPVVAPAKTVVAPEKPKPVEALLAKVEAVPEPTKIVAPSPAAQRVTRDFINSWGGAVPHEVSDTTKFPEALLTLEPGHPKPKWIVPSGFSGMPTSGLTADGRSSDLFVKDWTGIVLTPIIAQVAKAYATGVQLTNVEVHPLSDGRVRVWARLRNIRGTTMPAEIACTFKIQGQSENFTPSFYHLEIPAGESRDVFFISKGDESANYTVLVRDALIRQQQAKL